VHMWPGAQIQGHAQPPPASSVPVNRSWLALVVDKVEKEQLLWTAKGRINTANLPKELVSVADEPCLVASKSEDSKEGHLTKLAVLS
jgi:hypothetical protein